jgi:hypothetical protein
MNYIVPLLGRTLVYSALFGLALSLRMGRGRLDAHSATCPASLTRGAFLDSFSTKPAR